MRKTFNTTFEIVNRDLDESVTISYSATFTVAAENKTEPETWDFDSIDFEVEYYPKWLPKQDIEGHAVNHATTYLFTKNPKHPLFL